MPPFFGHFHPQSGKHHHRLLGGLQVRQPSELEGGEDGADARHVLAALSCRTRGAKAKDGVDPKRVNGKLQVQVRFQSWVESNAQDFGAEGEVILKSFGA